MHLADTIAVVIPRPFAVGMAHCLAGPAHLR